jgi:hypothetical protein
MPAFGRQVRRRDRLSREARIGGTPGSRSLDLPCYVTSFSLRARRYLRAIRT